MRGGALAAAALLLALTAGPVAAGDAVAGDAAAGDAAAGKVVAEARAALDPPPPGPEASEGTPVAPPPTGNAAAVPAALPATSGVAIYQRFVEGLAQPACEDASPRWRQHFAHVPDQLVSTEGEVLPLFGYVVEALRAAHLPTEYALIPFVESGYRPGARSGSGPAGLWQFIAVTARNHDIPVRSGYDGRLSPVDATRAAVRYLKTLHGMFAGDWRLAVMAFNAGEYRVLGALRRHGQRAADADPEGLESLAGITRSYVRKLHALSCLMVEAGRDAAWTESLDRPVARLVAVDLDNEPAGLDGYARRNGLDPARLRRLNPALSTGAPPGRKILVPRAAAATPAAAGVAN
ncbi:lytic transglycosylase domain-containing protein [Luteimonas sp. MC1750]|uniref:lytic transglycosylase domain-containing protein n=1 Tax=Luteimonas sp. MC1750 TaxID=2799326 RepID=UPI0018F0B1B0|nr:lytic transglycosylase domain-containing protein [Luteimonas sp. MC1750]MBJ6983109.1 lytic transglycosylase domain-containing protein [Luteimonas sp. MC1750]QQO05181.1 lytic transglycosylase domain-containing protein [Luteimonas sp. MC1750]